MPMAAGVAAHNTGVSLAAGDADGRPANDVNRQLKPYQWRVRFPNGIRCRPSLSAPAGRPDRRSGFMISLASWWWPKRRARVPGARTAVLVAGLGAALFGASALLLKTGTLGWDVSLFRILNQVPAAAASGPDALVASVPAPPASSPSSCSPSATSWPGTGGPAGGHRGRGRRPGMGAGACGESRCRPAPTV